MPTATFTCSKDASALSTGASNWSGWDDHHPVGLWAAGFLSRAFLYFPFSKAGMVALTGARLKLRATDFHVGASTNSVRVQARRMTSDWGEGSNNGENLWSNEDWGWGVADNYTSSGGGHVDSTVDGDGPTVTIDVLGIVQAWFDGSPNYGILLRAEDEGERGKEYGSRHKSGYVPTLEVDYTTNTAPNAPTGLFPTGDTVRNTGPSTTLSGVRSDPDAGDYITAYQTELYADDGTTLLKASGTVTVSGSPTTFSRTEGGLAGRTFYKWRARTRDKSSVWGPWSTLQRFYLNTPPNAPTGLQATTVGTPTFSGQFSDPDAGETFPQVQLEVERVSDSVQMWSSGDLATSGSSFSKAYAGTALTVGVNYRVRARAKDASGAYGAWSAWLTFAPVTGSGPTVTPNIAAKVNTLTPSIVVAQGAAFVNHEIEVADAITGTPLRWDPAPGVDYAAATSKATTYAGTALAWGGTYYVRARVNIGGVWQAWSAWQPFRVNANPSAPSGLTIAGGPPGSVTTDTTPDLSATFEDPDKATYGDTVSRAEHEITRVDTGAHVGGSPIVKTTGTIMTATPTALPVDVPLRYRVRTRDNSGNGIDGAWSSYAAFRVSVAPTVGATSPAGGAVIASTFATLDWTFTGSGGKTQATYRVRVFDTTAGAGQEVLVYDTGVILGTATEHALPLGTLVNGRSYRWQVDVTDTDGLAGVLA